MKLYENDWHHKPTTLAIIIPDSQKVVNLNRYSIPNTQKGVVDSNTSKFIQERRLKCLITLGGLEIGIQHQIVNALELSTINEKLFILVIGLFGKIGRIVKQSNDLKTSSIPLLRLEAQLWSLSLVAVLLILFVCHVHSGSHQYSRCIRISSAVANRYRKSTSLLKRSVSITSIS